MALRLTTDERAELERRVRSLKIRSEDARRARVILMLANGDSYTTIEATVPCYRNYINRWRRRFLAGRLEGLRPRYRGQPPTVLTPAMEARVLERVWRARRAPVPSYIVVNMDERELTVEFERDCGGGEIAPIRVAPDDLEPDTLRAVIESFVLREGTDYGVHETSLEDKFSQVLIQLRRDEAHITFDPATESINVVVTSAISGSGRP
jgi:uncharacterized protein YheU (UPF0270 family)/transposase